MASTSPRHVQAAMAAGHAPPTSRPPWLQPPPCIYTGSLASPSGTGSSVCSNPWANPVATFHPPSPSRRGSLLPVQGQPHVFSHRPLAVRGGRTSHAHALAALRRRPLTGKGHGGKAVPTASHRAVGGVPRTDGAVAMSRGLGGGPRHCASHAQRVRDGRADHGRPSATP